MVLLARDATVMPDDSLAVAASQTVLVDAISPTAFTGSVTLTKCDSCTAPTVAVLGPGVSQAQFALCHLKLCQVNVENSSLQLCTVYHFLLDQKTVRIKHCPCIILHADNFQSSRSDC